MTTADAVAICDLAAAAYMTVDDAKAALAKVGATFVDRFGSDQCQVLLADWNGMAGVIWPGTRVTRDDGSFDPSIPEFWDDIDGVPAVFNGHQVHSGFYSPMVPVAQEVQKRLPADKPVLVGGHSLGGTRAHLSRIYWRDALIVSFGAPKAATEAAWSSIYGGTSPPLRIVAEKDFAQDWAPLSRYVQPCPRAWLHKGNIAMATGWPYIPGPDSISEHDVTTSYRALLEAARVAGVAMPLVHF